MIAGPFCWERDENKIFSETGLRRGKEGFWRGTLSQVFVSFFSFFAAELRAGQSSHASGCRPSILQFLYTYLNIAAIIIWSSSCIL